ncbi:DNA mismatch repair endonuclease MutL [Limnochorda pilosa]|uniref:DNA mismatch repair protein MutL n=1 Tax=Limnochorda pilosa TaxID=1555112 RepID=A0A0K2SKF1_LIMPI|nr:DNA mismatch repair endonuclease MutL [Limnochorda pilosa]BAS27575.1 DNA mismatch repair protein MutL [Limnochorda pilosa]
MTPAPIRRLDDALVNRIAAGEVVERPASVVKELVENALDAGARRIRVELADGGKERIRVLDDGHGVPPEELPLAFERHATSKLTGPADLLAIRSLGFRGEALPSIAAVARVSFRSRTPRAPEGAVIRFEGGRLVGVQAAGGPEGTDVEVRDLFFNTPARLRFLKASATERRHAAEVVTQMALAYPEVAFELWSEGREALRTPGDGEPGEALAAVFGRETARRFLALAREGEGVALSGFLGPPETARMDRGGQHLFINRRWVRSPTLAAAVERGYQGLLMTRQHPSFVLHLTLDPAEVDVNVHPAKAEVRLRRERELFAAVVRAVGERLLGAGLGRRLTVPAGPASRGGRTGSGIGGSYVTGTPFAGEVRDQARLSPAGASLAPPPDVSRPEPAIERGERAPAADEGPADETERFREALRACRALAQLGRTYVVAEGADGLWLVDQHAAHERVLFDRLRRAREAAPAVQGLLVPLELELSPERFDLLWEGREELARLGFEVERFGSHSLRVMGMPAELSGLGTGGLLEAAVEELLDLWREEGRRRPERALAVLACKAAVKAGDRLGPEQMQRLLEELAETEAPFTCPHGRPTTLSHPWSDLERRFGRRR